jgi:hypothetical protein
MRGKTRCQLHGGKTPKGTKGNRTHGLYSTALNDDEKVLWNEMQLSTVDDEIRLCRIQLHRAMTLEASVAKSPNDPKNLAGVELVEIRRTTANGKSGTDVVSKRPDVMGRMNWLLGRIAQLKKTRAELITAAQASGKQGLDVRFVVEIPPEENAAEWLASYRGTALSSTSVAALNPDDDDDDKDHG